MLAFCWGCGSISIEEFPQGGRIERDAEKVLADASQEAGLVLHTSTLNERDYVRKDGTIDYKCSLQYAWNEYSPIQTDDFDFSYTLDGSGKWNLSSWSSDGFDKRLLNKFVMHRLYLDAPLGLNKEAAPTGVAKSSDEPARFSFQVGGDVYALFLVPFVDFIANGWEIAEDSSHTMNGQLPANTYETVPLVKDGQAITVYVVNHSMEDRPLGAGAVGGLSMRSDEAQLSFQTITSDSTLEEVVAAMGEPSTTENAEQGRRITYAVDAMASVSFLFAQGYTQVEVMNLYGYEAPIQTNELFDRYNGGFILDGATYRARCLVDEFISNGWQLPVDAPVTLRWYQSCALTLTKDEQAIHILADNASIGDLALASAQVVRLEVGAGTDFQLSLSGNADGGGVSPETDEAAVISALGEPTQIETLDGARTLVYTQNETSDIRIVPGKTIQLCWAAGGDSLDLTDASMEANIFGTIYSLPVSAAQLNQSEWKAPVDWNEPVSPGFWAEFDITDDAGDHITLNVCNDSAESVPLGECLVYGVYGSGNGLTLGGMIGVGSTQNDIFERLGMPAVDQQKDGIRTLYYVKSAYRFIGFQLIDDRVTKLCAVNFER